MRKFLLIGVTSGLLFAVACGGGSSSSTTTSSKAAVAECIQFLDNSYLWGSVRLADVRMGGTALGGTAVNVAPLAVDAGPAPSNPQTNVAFTTVEVCAPGTTNCVTIDDVAVDTGSTGLRIPASLLSSLNLPSVYSNSTPSPTGGTSNGSELASSVPILVIGDTSLPSVPSTCSTITGSSTAGTEEDTVATLGANGLIGVGNYQYDCDAPGSPFNVNDPGAGTYGIGSSNACSPSSGNSTPPPATYYTCSSSSCSPALVSGPLQVRNPVSLFADNNGVILQLQSVPTGVGALNASGTLVFGIGTQNGALDNNGLGSATVLPIDTTYVDNAWLGITTKFNNAYYPPLGTYTATGYTGVGSFFDSGSNGIYFLDTPTSGVADCSSTSSAGDYFYCPTTSPDSLTATNQVVSNGAANGATAAAPFTISNASTLFNTSPTYAAFSDLGGPNTPGTKLSSSDEAADEYFDWGLPFFYGKSVYTAIWGVTPPSGVPAGPFWAY